MSVRPSTSAHFSHLPEPPNRTGEHTSPMRGEREGQIFGGDRVAVSKASAARESLFSFAYRLCKLSPWRYYHDERWERRTYPCSRWWCFRRSPAWRSYSREGRAYCDRHLPQEDDWTPYHEFRKRTDPPPFGMGMDE